MHSLVTACRHCALLLIPQLLKKEVIDVLAAYLGKGQQVAVLTAQAMESGMKFQDALQARLDLLRPSREQIHDCLAVHPFRLTPGVEIFIQTLHRLGKVVYLVSAHHD